MSKTLDQILSGADSEETTVAPDAAEDTTQEPATNTTADEETASVDPELDTTADPDASIEDKEDDTVTTGATEPAQAVEDEIVSVNDVKDNTEPCEAEHSEAFVAKFIRLNKPATLYATKQGSRKIGAYKGVVRQLTPSVGGFALVEYSILSTGGKVLKRAYIHI